MGSKIVSEANGTGEKLKTFVAANGVTLAEQQITRYGSTVTEILLFLHQDPSGASVQQTKANGDLAQPNVS